VADTLRVLLVVAAGAFLAAGEGSAALKSVLVLAPALCARAARAPAGFDLAFTAALAVEAMGTGTGAYEWVGWGDSTSHLVIPFLSAPVVYHVLMRLGAAPPADVAHDRRAFAAAGLVAAISVLALGTLWELVEWGADSAFGTEYSQGYLDTLTDLLADTIAATLGGLLVAAWLRARLRGRPSADLGEATPQDAGERLSAAVVVCAATRDREPLLRACIRSLAEGTRIPDEILVVIDGNPALEASVAAWLPGSVRLLRSHGDGISASRNVGLSAARSDIVAFVDDDALVESEWLSCVLEEFEASEDLLGVGGAVEPCWDGDRRWLPDELLWVVGCTYAGHRRDSGPIRNPIGCNMAFRRRELAEAGGFAPEFGKRGAALTTCDETELGLRIERLYGPGRIRSAPAARVRHVIPGSRIGWKKLAVRCVSEGLAKRRLRHLYGDRALSAERTYARELVTHAAPRLFIRGVTRRDRRSLLGAGAILLSLGVTAGAYAAGSLVAESPGPRRAAAAR
jgi:glucosyl-dolichyl phosphate glucuronosyltransferase